MITGVYQTQTGQGDEVFKEVIKQIERKIWTISYDLTKNED